MSFSRPGRWPTPRTRVEPPAPPPFPDPPSQPGAKPKLAAMQHGTVTWRSDAGKQATLAKYDMVMMNMYTGLSGVPAGLDAIRAINPDIYITQYVQAWETRSKGIYSITNVSGTTYLVTLDGTSEGANSSMVDNNLANGVTMYIRQAGDFDGDYTVSGLTTISGRRAFNITAASGIANQTGAASRGCCIENTDAMAGRSLLAMEQDWMLRNTAGRIISTGVDDATRGVNLHDTVTPNGDGDYWPQVVADYNKTNIIDPFQPTTLDTTYLKGINGVFIDNWNYRPRTSLGVWGSTHGGPVSGGAIDQDNAALQTRCRNANRYFIEKIRSLHPGMHIIGNADNDLNYAEWPAGTLNGCFIESIGNIWMFDLTDKGAAIQTRLRAQKAKCTHPGLHVVHAKGTGATEAERQADYATFVRALAVCLMQGDTREEMSYYAFTPNTHDVTSGGNVWHDEYDATLGEPLDASQTAGRADDGWIWVRYFEGGVVVWNSHPTLSKSVDVRNVAGNYGHNYARINGTTNPFNTGAAVTGAISIPAKGGAIFLKDESAGPANTKYVRQGAAGSGSGDDWTNAYTALPTTLVRGQTYYVADGTYNGRTFNTPASSTTRITIKKATVADHGVSTGWSDAYGDGTAEFTSQMNFTTHYWTLDGQTGGGPGNWDGPFGFKFSEDTNWIVDVPTGGGHVTVKHTEFAGFLGGGDNDAIHCQGPGLHVSHCKFDQIGGSHLFICPDDFLIEYSWFHEFYSTEADHAEVASIWDIGVGISDSTFRYNLVTCSRGTGGLIYDNSGNPSASFFIYGNVFYKPSGVSWDLENNGLISGWQGPPEEFHNVKVYNNAFIDIPGPTLGGLSSNSSGGEARNNLWVNCDAPDFNDFPGHNHNHFIASGGIQGEANGTSAASGNPFTDKANFDFTLTGATVAGTTLSSPFNQDGLGVTRGADGVWDRGAYEYSSGPDVTPPNINSRTPAASATDVSILGNITVTFNEAMDEATITGSTFELRDSSAALVSAVVSYDSGSFSAILNPDSDLVNEETYTAKVFGGSSGVKDIAGNALASDSSWTFTTEAESGGGDTTEHSLWDHGTVTVGGSAGADSAVSVGTRFQSSLAGYITKISCYRHAGGSGTHIAVLWDADGDELGRATMTVNTGVAGWYEVTLASPIAITADTTYTASVLMPTGHYAATADYFRDAAHSNPPLTGIQKGATVPEYNGVFAYGASPTWPDDYFDESCYWVDVTFVESLP